jgi:hypothetical protein
VALRTGHGNGAGVPRVEVLPVDELPAGVPGPARPQALRDEAGRFLPGPGTSDVARSGALAAAQSRQLAALLGLWAPPEGHAYEAYARLAREWRDEQMAALAASVGGGSVGPGPASVISSAALQLGASRWLADKGAREGDAKALLDASKLADASRQNVLAAHELAAREAKARPRDPAAAAPWLYADQVTPPAQDGSEDPS